VLEFYDIEMDHVDESWDSCILGIDLCWDLGEKDVRKAYINEI